MHRTLICCAVLLLLALAPLSAMAQDGDLETGFKLGRYSMGAAGLAMELTYLSALIDEAHLEAITQEAYDAGEITDEAVDLANSALVYAIWRMQFYIDPTLEAAADGESFSHPALAEFKEPTLAIFAELQALRDEFMEDSDLAKLADLNQAIKDGEYLEQLLVLSDAAAEAAGMSPE